MIFSKQGLKELMDHGANQIIYDNYPVEDLQFLANHAKTSKRQLTIRVLEKGLEDLKKISSSGEGWITIQS